MDKARFSRRITKSRSWRCIRSIPFRRNVASSGGLERRVWKPFVQVCNSRLLHSAKRLYIGDNVYIATSKWLSSMVAKKQFDCTRDTKSEAAMMYLKAASVCWGADIYFLFILDMKIWACFFYSVLLDLLMVSVRGNQVIQTYQNDAIVTLALCEFQ